MRIAVIGAGSWGTAVADMVGRKQPVTLWARREELVEAINTTRTNPDYLPDHSLSEGVTASSDLEQTLARAEAIVMGVPSHGYRSVLELGSARIAPDTPIISLAKGVERDSLMRMTEVTADVLPGHRRDRIGVLTGPNLAREIVAGQPAATVIALEDERAAKGLQEVFVNPSFRVYTNTDVIGSESAGALKNVMAIAAGMAHGLGFGDNTMATLITRALAELTRLGIAMGGRPLTFAGLAGMGDLIATCMSSQSRNHTVGYGLGQGKKLDEIIAEMNQVAEGVKSTPGILALADRHQIEMPIAIQVARVLYEGASPLEAVSNLMGRAAKPETHGIGG
ncbi:MAG: NAD(P)H-dependent glycerol-3-phosphate dehydrogenase [Acidimicrobiia bacterium]|nr:NAD(P)H-dependent glycerol-3-phosphate dehydrogenase [Acidimicrobiia bacterium]